MQLSIHSAAGRRGDRVSCLLLLLGAYLVGTIWTCSDGRGSDKSTSSGAEDWERRPNSPGFLPKTFVTRPGLPQRAGPQKSKLLATNTEAKSVDHAVEHNDKIEVQVVAVDPGPGLDSDDKDVKPDVSAVRENNFQVVGAVFVAFLVGVGLGLSTLVKQPQAPQVVAQQTAPAAAPGVITPKMTPVLNVPAAPALTDLTSVVQKVQTKSLGDDEFTRAYASVMEAARSAGTKLEKTVQSVIPNQQVVAKDAPSRVAPSVVKKIREIADTLDELQADIYNETWVSMQVYPQILKAYMPLLTYYGDAAFPSGGDSAREAINAATRDGLRFEAQSFAKGVSRLQDAIAERKVRSVEEAFAKTSLAYDRYLKAGDLYTGYDPVTSTTIFFQDISDSQLQYTPAALEQPRIRDEVLVLQGPDKGKVGRVIWLGREDADDLNSKVLSAVVKLDPNPTLGSTPQSNGIREVKAYPYTWIVQTRSSTQNFGRDFVLATIAAVVSCGLTYPLENIKVRAQLNLPWIPPEGPFALLRGVWINVAREAPNAGVLMAGFNLLTRFAVGLPFINSNDPNLKFLLMIPSGVLAMSTGALLKVPLVDMSKQIQAGTAGDVNEAFQNVYVKPSFDEVSKKLATVLTLTIIRVAPFGAFQCFIYELLKDKTPTILENAGVPITAEPFIWGAVAGFCTGFLTNPPDVILTRMAVKPQSESSEFSLGGILQDIRVAASEILQEEGPIGFAKGGLENAIYYAPEAMIWFGTYEALKDVTEIFQ